MSRDNYLKRMAEIQEREKASTLGPWYIEGSEVRHDFDSYCTNEGISDCSVQICDLYRISEELDHRSADREFIAESRTTIPALLSALEIAVSMLEILVKDRCECAATEMGLDCWFHVGQDNLRRIYEIIGGEE